MFQSSTRNLVLLDHSYSCVLEPEFGEEFYENFTDLLPFLPPYSKMDAEIDFSSIPSCSPAYSSDSGIDSIYADLPWDFNVPNDDTAHSKWIDMVLDGSSPEPRNQTTTFQQPNNTPRVSVGKNIQSKCISEEDVVEKNRKNAEAARENRQKKKKYLEGLEKEVKELREQNSKLSSQHSGMKALVSSLKEEVKYLRSVIGNQGTLSLLLNRISTTPGIALSSSFTTLENVDPSQPEKNKEDRRTTLRKRKMECPDNNGSPAKKKSNNVEESRGSGGVCLHVSQDKVSLEFCAKCSQNAKKSWK